MGQSAFDIGAAIGGAASSLLEAFGIGYTQEERARDTFNRQRAAYQDQQAAELALMRQQQQAAAQQAQFELQKGRLKLEQTKIIIVGIGALVGAGALFYALKD